MGFASACVHDLKDPRTTEPHQLPIYATSSFRMETLEQGIDIFAGKAEGHTYGRYRNPTIDMVAQKIANLEAFGFAETQYVGAIFQSTKTGEPAWDSRTVLVP